MDAVQSQHLGRVRQLRESFAEANERLVARLRGASDEAAGHAPEGEWSAAQIGWHVAAVTTRLAGLISGDVAGAQPLTGRFPRAVVARGRRLDSSRRRRRRPPWCLRRAYAAPTRLRRLKRPGCGWRGRSTR